MSEIINNYKSGKPFNYADAQELHELKKQFCLKKSSSRKALQTLFFDGACFYATDSYTLARYSPQLHKRDYTNETFPALSIPLDAFDYMPRKGVIFYNDEVLFWQDSDGKTKAIKYDSELIPPRECRRLLDKEFNKQLGTSFTYLDPALVAKICNMAKKMKARVDFAHNEDNLLLCRAHSNEVNSTGASLVALVMPCHK